MSFQFLDFKLDPTIGALTGPEGEIRLRPKTLSLLELLVADAPAVLTKDELMDRIWGHGHLGETSLAQAVSELRRALGDDPRKPRIIETLHRRGYRFIAPLTPIETEDSLLPPHGQTEIGPAATNPRPLNPAASPLAKAPGAIVVPGPPTGLPAPDPTPVPPPLSRPSLTLHRWAAALALAVAVVSLALLGGAAEPPDRGASSVSFDESARQPAAEPALERVAILPFSLQDHQPLKGVEAYGKWLEAGLPMMIGTKLQNHRKIYVYPIQRTETMVEDLPFLKEVGRSRIDAVGNYLDADWVLKGSLVPVGNGEMLANLSLYSLSDGREAWAVEETVEPSAISWDCLRWVAEIKQNIDPRNPPYRSQQGRYGPSMAVFERFFKAYRLASQDPDRALELLQAAAELAPNHPVIAAARGKVLLDLGRLEDAREVARHGRRISKDRRLDVWFLSVLGQSEGALRLLHSLPPKIGRDPELWLESLEVLHRVDQPATVLTWLDAMPQDLRESWLEAEFNLLEAGSAAALGNPQRAQEARDRAIEAARSRAQHGALTRASEQLARF